MKRLIFVVIVLTLGLSAAHAQSQLLGQEKKLLEMTRSNWVSFRDFNGQQLIYFTHLEVYRCGISQVRYSLNTDRLDREWKLAKCDPKNPHAIPEDYLPYLTLPLGTARSIVVQVTFIDGTTSGTVHQFAQ